MAPDCAVALVCSYVDVDRLLLVVTKTQHISLGWWRLIDYRKAGQLILPISPVVMRVQAFQSTICPSNFVHVVHTLPNSFDSLIRRLSRCRGKLRLGTQAVDFGHAVIGPAGDFRIELLVLLRLISVWGTEHGGQTVNPYVVQTALGQLDFEGRSRGARTTTALRHKFSRSLPPRWNTMQPVNRHFGPNFPTTSAQRVSPACR